MVKVIFNGGMNSCRVVVADMLVYWRDGEVKEIEDRYAKLLVANSYGGDILPYLTPEVFHFKYVDKENTKIEKVEKTTINMDLNNDGVVDRKDKAIAAKVLATNFKQ